MLNVRIHEIEIEHGEEIVSNHKYIEHFKKRNKDIEFAMTNIFGRDKRFMISSEKESALTLSTKAALKVLDKTNLTGSDIDMIVYSSLLPEYVSPPNSIFIHEAINGKRETVCYDINCNCAGMLVAIDQISTYMKNNDKINKALLVGCDLISLMVDPENELTYGNYGDLACAVILEKTNEYAGLIESKYYINSEEVRNILFPRRGFSETLRTKNGEDLLLQWNPFDGSACTIPAIAAINDLLDKYSLTKRDIKAYCLSQFAYKNIELIQNALELDKERFIFIGDKYGYTGTSSPLVALYEGIQRGLVNRNDYIIFWTIGSGSQGITMLYKF